MDLDLRACADAPGGACEIPGAVHRHHDRLLEGRDIEGGREMRQMVLDVPDPSLHIGAKALPELGINGRPPARVPEPVENEAQVRALAQREEDLAREIGRWVAIDG